jgi:hypothetical protein
MGNFTWHGFLNLVLLLVAAGTAVFSGNVVVGGVIAAVGLFVKQLIDLLYGPISPTLAQKLRLGAR